MKTCIHCEQDIGVDEYGSICHMKDGSLYCTWQSGCREVIGRAQKYGSMPKDHLPTWEDPDKEEPRKRLIDTFPTY